MAKEARELARDSARGGKCKGSGVFDFAVGGTDVEADATADSASPLRPGGDAIAMGDSVSSELPASLLASVSTGAEGFGAAAASSEPLVDGLLSKLGGWSSSCAAVSSPSRMSSWTIVSSRVVSFDVGEADGTSGDPDGPATSSKPGGG